MRSSISLLLPRRGGPVKILSGESLIRFLGNLISLCVWSSCVLPFASRPVLAQCPTENPGVATVGRASAPARTNLIREPTKGIVAGAVSSQLSTAKIDARHFLQHPDRRLLEETGLSAQTIFDIESAWRSVLTQHNDNQRTGAYTYETALSPESLRVNAFGLKVGYPVVGRIDAQLLYAHGIPVNGSLHNALYAVTMCNYVYAFDPDSTDGGHLWPIPLILKEQDQLDQWTALASAPVAAGDPAITVIADQQHVFYRGTDGAINHIFWDGSFHHDQWTALAGAPVAAGNPAITVIADQQHVFYRGTDGAINHIFWDGSFHHDQWTALAGAPVAACHPTITVIAY